MIVYECGPRPVGYGAAPTLSEDITFTLTLWLAPAPEFTATAVLP